MNKSAKYEAIAALFIILFCVAAAAGVYFYLEARDLEKNPQKITQKDIEEVVEQVGKLMVLPEGETPTVATVSDPQKLKDQPFFANAKVGYRVLIYTKAKRAILYDPVNNKIVEVAPVTIGNPGASSLNVSPPDKR